MWSVESPQPFKLPERYPPGRDRRTTEEACIHEIRRINGPGCRKERSHGRSRCSQLTASPVVISRARALRGCVRAHLDLRPPGDPRARGAATVRTQARLPVHRRRRSACVHSATSLACTLPPPDLPRRPRWAHSRCRGGEGGTAKPIAHGAQAQDPHARVINLLPASSAMSGDVVSIPPAASLLSVNSRRPHEVCLVLSTEVDWKSPSYVHTGTFSRHLSSGRTSYH